MRICRSLSTDAPGVRCVPRVWCAVAVLDTLLATALSGAPPSPAPSGDVLRPGVSVEREIAAGEGHRFRVVVEPGSMFTAILDQQGINLSLALVGPTGADRRAVDSTVGGEERLMGRWEEGTVVEVTASAGGPRPGRYALRLADVRLPDATDRVRLEIQARMLAAEAESARRTAASMQAALDGFRETARCAGEIGDARLKGFSLLATGELLLTRGEGPKALDVLTEALASLRLAGDRAGEAQALATRGSALENVGDFARAVESQQQAAALFGELASLQGQGSAYNNMGWARSRLGERVEALRDLERSLAFRREAGDRRGEATTLNNLGLVLHDLGESQRAIDAYEQSLAIRKEIDDKRGQAFLYNALGVLYDNLGEKEKRLEFYRLALPLRRAVGDRRGEAFTLNNIAKSLMDEGRLDEAKATFEEALALFRSLGFPEGEAGSLSSLGTLASRAGRHDEALELQRRALAVYRTTGIRGNQAMSLIEIGTALLGLSRGAEAEASFAEGLTLARQSGERRREVAALTGLARARRLAGDLDGALVRLGEAEQVTEALRLRLGNPDLRASFFADRRAVHELTVRTLMDVSALPGRGAEAARALEASERSRARSLLELLAEARVDVRAGAAPELLAEERRLRDAVARKTDRQLRLLARKHTAEEETAAAAEVDEAVAALSRVEARLRVESPRYASLKQPRPLSADGIRALLEPGTVLVEYFLGEERSFAWVVTTGTVRPVVLGARDAIETSARLLHQQLSGGRDAPVEAAAAAKVPRNDEPAGAALAAAVLDPLHLPDGTRRLVVVPDGALHYVPFAVLPDPGSPARAPLVDRLELVAAPSASAVALLRETWRRREAPARVLTVLADPVFSAADPRVAAASAGKAPSSLPSLAAFELGRSARDAGLDAPLGLPRLGGSRREAEAIAALVPAGKRFVALDFDASVETLAGPGATPSRFLHLGTHGLLNSRDARLSGVVLSLVGRDGGAREGFLKAADVFNLTLPADTVVLSGCQTALGKDVRGEGLVGLVQAFFYAGASRVVASLHGVEDEATARLMARLYEGALREGLDVPGALARAQRTLRRQPRTKDPARWAGFVVLGDWR